MKPLLTCLTSLLLLALSLAPLTAQELTTGTITGKVTDLAGRPIAGAIVIVVSEAGTRTAATDANGGYIVPFLRPGSYTVRVEAAGGFTTVIRSDIAVALNQRVTLNFTLEPGKTESVTVRGSAPLIDTTSTATGTSLKYDDFANSVPLGRSFTDTYAVAPGVVSGLGTGQGNYSISGATGLENSYLIDGVNITNTGFGGIGAYNIVYGSLGTGVTSEFLTQVQIKTGGFEAEYGQALGGIINTIVKSGTNDFKGSVAWYATPRSWRSSYTPVDLTTGTSNTLAENVNDFAFSVGGPIKKDKLFYFFAFNPVTTVDSRRANSLDNPAFAPAQAGVSVFDEGLPTGFGGTTYATNRLAFPSSTNTLDRTRRADNYALKISWQASPSNQVDFTFFGDPATGSDGPQRDNAPQFSDFATGGGESKIRFGSNNQSIKWNSVFSPKFFMEAQVARHAGVFKETSAVNDYDYRDLRNLLEFTRGADSYNDPALGIQPLQINPVAPNRGGVGFITNQDDRNTVYTVKLTNILGTHELKYGVEYDDISYQETPTYTGPSFNIQLPISYTNGLPVDNNGDGVQDTISIPTRGGATVDVRNGVGADPAVAFDSGNRFRVTRARLGPEIPPTLSKESNLFIEDHWTVAPRVTLNVGLRATEEKVQGAGSFTLPFATEIVQKETFSGSGFFVPTRIFTPGTSSYSPNSYTFGGNIAPRIGVSWDVRGDGKSRAYLNFGRYYERVPNDLAVRSFSNEVGISVQDFTDRALAHPRTIAGGAGACVDSTGVDTSLGGCATLAPLFTQGIDQTAVVGGVKLPYEDELSGGYSFEITPDSSLEVRGIYRTQGRILEDVQVNAIEQTQNFYYGVAYGFPYDPFGGVKTVNGGKSTTFPATPFGAYFLANPGTKEVPAGGLFNFPKPERVYKSLEMIYTRRMSNHWSLYANYRLSKLEGNYEGLYRNDNGQSDPNITSLYDFPNSPLMSGQFLKGPLPADARHVLHVYPSYEFVNKLRVGANLSYSTGVPRTSLLAHPSYQNAGEIPGIDPVYAYWADPVGNGSPGDYVLRSTSSLSAALSDVQNVIGTVFLKSYTPVTRGNLGRTPGFTTVDLHADYPVQLAKSQMRIMLDVFNVLDRQTIVSYDDDIELRAGVTDPDFGQPISFQAPRSWRLAARWEF